MGDNTNDISKYGDKPQGDVNEPLISAAKQPAEPVPGNVIEISTQEVPKEISAITEADDVFVDLPLDSDPNKSSHIEQFELEKDEDEEDEEDPNRAAWGGKMQFIFTCIGYAVGLGNVWRFPYLCYKNGGGAFLIPYIIMLGVVGLPLFFMELAFGQFASLGPITIWRINPLMKGLGYAMVAVSWLIGVYYNVVISHVMLYLFASFASVTSDLPWTTCDNWWNTEHCIQPDYNKTSAANTTIMGNISFKEVIGEVTTAVTTKLGSNRSMLQRTPAEEYYNHYVLEMSESMDDMGAINWKLALCLLLAWLVVLVCLIRGIESLGKVVYFTALFPYFMLTVLFITGVMLEGASDGIIFYLKPDFSRLSDPRVWSDAATQIFYSLSACSGGLIAMASYNKFDNNCLKDAIIVSLINCATSLYAGFVIFAILGFIAHEKGVDVSEVVDEGPGLAFVVYPEAISRMPAPQLWAICFFFMMATLGFGSQFSIVECVLSALSDEFAPYLKKKWQSILFRTIIILITFLLGLPMVTKGGIYLLTLVDYSVSGFPLLFVGLLELISLNYIYGYSQFSSNIQLMLGLKPNIFWKACWMVVSPLVIVVTIFFNCIFYKPPDLSGQQYPYWAQVLGWFIALWPILMIPGYFLFRFCIHGGFALSVKLMKPAEDWGPANIEDKKRYFAANETRPLTPEIATNDPRFTFDVNTTAVPITLHDPKAPAKHGKKLKKRKSAADANALWNQNIDKDVDAGTSDTGTPGDSGNSSLDNSDKTSQKPPKKKKNLRIKIEDSNFKNSSSNV